MRRAADHVLQELDVARRVDDQEVALLGLEEDPRGVNRDPLRLLVLERVEQEGVLERLGIPLSVGLDHLELALGERVGIHQQPADDGALAVVDVPGDDEIQPLAALGRRHM
jgi:hypothetical protein